MDKKLKCWAPLAAFNNPFNQSVEAVQINSKIYIFNNTSTLSECEIFLSLDPSINN